MEQTLGKRKVGAEFTASQKRLMREPIMDVAAETDLQEVTGVYSPELDDRTLRQMGNERPYKLKKTEPTVGTLHVDPFGLDLDEPLPQSGGRRTRRNKKSGKKSNKRKSSKKSHKKRTLRNKKGSRKHCK